MRGKARLSSGCRARARITPAYAGKSPLLLRSRSLWGDHPRLCGEKQAKTYLTQSKKGSPPPMRGKDSVTLYRDHVVRITPAYAGKSHVSIVTSSHLQDHPRLCGEK